MKPRRLRLSVDLLPTISEMHEDAPQVKCPGLPSQSLEEYFNSIKELAQPALLPGCGPLRVQRPQRLRLSSVPLSTRSSGATMPCSAIGAYKPCISVSLNNITLQFATSRDCNSSLCATRDPLDWLFAQTQCGDSSLMGNMPAALCLL